MRARAARARAVVLAAALACGCRDRDEPSEPIRLWAMGSEGEAVAQLIPAFEQANPGLRVRTQQIPWSAAHEKLLTAYVGETMPDVFQLGNTWIPELVALGALAPLSARLDSSATIAREDYFEGIFEPNVIDGTVYAVPWYVDTRLLFYRSDLLEQAGYQTAPRSWREWVEAMRRIRKADEQRYAILLPFSEWEPPVIFAMQLNADLLRDGDRYGNFRSTAFRLAFEFYLDLFRRDLAPRGSEAQASDPHRDFAAGFFCFYISGPWNLSEFGRRMPEPLQEAWATAPMPSPEGKEVGVSLAGGASLAVFRGTRNADAAWRLVEFLSEPAQQAALYRLTGDLPSRQSAWAAARLRGDARAEAFWHQLQHVRPTPKVPEWERIAAKIGEHAENVIRGSADVSTALKQLDADADAILAKRRSLLAAQQPEASQ